MNIIGIIAILILIFFAIVLILSLLIDDLSIIHKTTIFSLLLIIISVIFKINNFLLKENEFNLENKNQTFYQVSDIKKISENKDKNIVIKFKTKNKIIIVNRDNIIDVDHKIDKKYRGNNFFAVSELTTKKNKKVNVIYKYSANNTTNNLDEDGWTANIGNPANPISPLNPTSPIKP